MLQERKRMDELLAPTAASESAETLQQEIAVLTDLFKSIPEVQVCSCELKKGRVSILPCF
jgi:hypothetical protein